MVKHISQVKYSSLTLDSEPQIDYSKIMVNDFILTYFVCMYHKKIHLSLIEIF